MGVFTDEWEGNTALRAVELHSYDENLLGANWSPAIGILALACSEPQRDWRPQLPEDSAMLEAGFVVRVRALASRI